MKLEFNETLCRGHGRCYALAEDLLDYDDEGYVTARGQVIDVPPDQVEDARNAAASCPERAIAVLED